MSKTNTPPSVSQSGNYAASISYSDRFFLENVRQMNFRRALTQPFHQDMKAVLGNEGQTQSSNTWPFILATDLTKMKGDQVTIDKLGRKQGTPVKGDVLVTDAAQPMDWQRDAVKIGLWNMPPINAGGLMNEQRSAHNQIVAQQIVASSYMSDLEDNQATVAICGARGYDTSSGWQLPVETPGDQTLGGLLDNPMLPPTTNRYYVCGATNLGSNGVTSFQAISASNTINLQWFDYLSTALQNSYYPLKGVKMADKTVGYDIGNGQTPVYIVGVTLEQYNTLKTQAVNTGDWNTFVALTAVRDSFMKHPLFNDMQIGRWRNCIFFIYGRPVTFPATTGVTTMYTDSTATTTGSATPAVRIQRGFVLGAEAAAIAFGMCSLRTSGKIAQKGGNETVQRLPYHWHTEVKEGAIVFCYAKMMMGIKKIRFPYSVNGVPTPYDAGVAVFDSYQAPNTDFSPV